jgi:glycosyltransferase involved in cell wall biosynthesis
MKILMVSNGCCIRVIKEGTTLEGLGHDVTYLHTKVNNPDLRQLLAKESYYDSPAMLRNKLVRFNPDIVHVHAEPATLVMHVWEMLPDVPIVFDIHDCLFMRYGDLLQEEVDAFHQADALVYPSKGYMLGITRACPKETDGKRNQVLRPYMPKHLTVSGTPPLSQIEGLVYEGGSVPRGDVKVSYRDFSDIIKRTHDENIPFFIFSANSTGLDYTASLYGLTFPRTPYIALLVQLSRFSYGLLAPGYFPDKHMEVCMPNKLFEYLSAGLPVITWGCSEVSEFVRENGCGEVLSHPDDLTFTKWQDLLGRRGEFLPAVHECNEKYTMESQLPVLEEIYADAIKHKKQRDD